MQKIIQIVSAVEEKSSALIYGLGEDNKIYWWSSEIGEWVLDVDKKA